MTGLDVLRRDGGKRLEQKKYETQACPPKCVLASGTGHIFLHKPPGCPYLIFLLPFCRCELPEDPKTEDPKCMWDKLRQLTGLPDAPDVYENSCQARSVEGCINPWIYNPRTKALILGQYDAQSPFTPRDWRTVHSVGCFHYGNYGHCWFAKDA